MNKRGFELAVSTLVVLVLAILIIIALALAFTGGFGKFWNTMKGYLISDVDAAKKACENACRTQSSYDFCCVQRDVSFGKEKVNLTCVDSRLKVSCDIDCKEVCQIK